MALENSMRFKHWSPFATFVIVLLCTGIAFSQALNFGSISGTIRDPSGAAIASARVRIIRTETDAARTAETGPDGFYQFPDIAAGTYRLEIEKEGFRKDIRDNIALSAGQSLRIDANLTLGSIAESVQVDSQVPQVDTSTANVGST